jgi:hypothetical protein
MVKSVEHCEAVVSPESTVPQQTVKYWLEQLRGVAEGLV